MIESMIKPKNNNLHFEPVQHLKTLDTCTLQNVEHIQVFNILKFAFAAFSPSAWISAAISHFKIETLTFTLSYEQHNNV